MFSEPIVGQERADLINEVLLCRARGMSLRRTARKLNISYTEVFRLEKEGIRDTVNRIDPVFVEEVRAQQLQKCQELYDILSGDLVITEGEGDKAVESANLDAIKAFIDVMEREAGIVGSDAPKRKEIEKKKVLDFSSEEARKAKFEEVRNKYPARAEPKAEDNPGRPSVESKSGE